MNRNPLAQKQNLLAEEPPQKADPAEALRALKEVFFNGLLFKNPVLVGAIGLCPVIAGGTTLKNGAALSLLLAVMLLPTCLIFSLVGDKVPMWLRPPAILVLSAALYVPAGIFTERLLPGSLAGLGFYAPLMVGNAIITSRAKNFSCRHIYYAAVVDAAGCALGFALVILIGSAIRELLAFGALWEQPIPGIGGIPASQYVFAGFVLVGLLAAVLQALRNRREKSQQKGGE